MIQSKSLHNVLKEWDMTVPLNIERRKYEEY
nr:MAG TPA: hypothetical protein [Caudoviricetes sp.]